MARAVLVRHGQTEWTMTHRHTGRTDIPLTGRGRKEAADIGRRLSGFDFELAMTSPALRTHETAIIAGYGGSAIVNTDLWEWDYGVYEGKRTVDIRSEIPGWSVWTHEIVGGENLSQLGARSDRVIERLMGVSGDVVVFGHGHALRVLAARWLGQDPRLGAHLMLSTASISILGFERETPAIVCWNEGASDAS
ncbi:MAG TPA: histidine phosphatase family protein [Acidimicrobiia bacterium]|nr:histidine phosphatase family protein [Acidimicrobiia bacterium]